MLPDIRLISRARSGRAPRTNPGRQRGHPLTDDRDGSVAHGGQGMECSGVVMMIAGTA